MEHDRVTNIEELKTYQRPSCPGWLFHLHQKGDNLPHRCTANNDARTAGKTRCG